MTFEWETDRERLLRLMKIPPKKKLEWLRQMQELNAKHRPRFRRYLRSRLRKQLST